MATVYAIIFAKQVRKQVKKSKYRQNILTEWLNTENSYNTDLKLALSHIKEPMLAGQIITHEESKILFPEFEGMIQLGGMMTEVIA